MRIWKSKVKEEVMIIIKNGTLLDPASNRSGMYDILIDEDRIARIGACGSLDDMAAE